MKLGLIWPKTSLTVNPDIKDNPKLCSLLSEYYSRNGHKPFPSVGAALPLVAALTPPVFEEILIIDGNKEDIPFDSRFDLVGISMMTAQATEGYRIAEEFRKRGVHVVVGGIHPTIMPYEAMLHCYLRLKVDPLAAFFGPMRKLLVLKISKKWYRSRNSKQPLPA